jgi:Integrase core domain
VADITYIRLHREFVFLAVILDAFSRKVVGWELDRTLAARLPIAALEKAIGERTPPPGVVHHSDRGVQYASGVYVALLRKHGLIPSMSRPANPYDNASCESFMKTLKREEIYANEYRDLDHLRENVAAFIDSYYNGVRLHSALGYKPPEEFEQASSPATISQGATMSFFRHEEIYRSDIGSKTEGEPAETGSPDHRLDESPAGYSLAGWSPPVAYQTRVWTIRQGTCCAGRISLPWWHSIASAVKTAGSMVPNKPDQQCGSGPRAQCSDDRIASMRRD